MLEDIHKLNVPSSGHKRVVPKEKAEKPKIKEGCFDPDEHENWLLNDDKEYKQPRKEYKKKKKLL
jgi:hypothetical protein